MIALRRSIAVMRTAFFVVAWSFAAFVPMVYGIVKLNVGFLAISVAILIVGGVTTRMPDEVRTEGLTEPLGRFLLALALCLSTFGVVLVWPR
jgi:hypothetical protein